MIIFNINIKKYTIYTKNIYIELFNKYYFEYNIYHFLNIFFTIVLMLKKDSYKYIHFNIYNTDIFSSFSIYCQCLNILFLQYYCKIYD